MKFMICGLTVSQAAMKKGGPKPSGLAALFRFIARKVALTSVSEKFAVSASDRGPEFWCRSSKSKSHEESPG